MLFFTSIHNSVYEYIPSPLFSEPRAVSLMRQYRNTFYSNADHTRRIGKGRDVTKSDACAQKTHRTHAMCIQLKNPCSRISQRSNVSISSKNMQILELLRIKTPGYAKSFVLTANLLQDFKRLLPF